MQDVLESITSASNKFMLPAMAWLAHWLHVALPDFVLLVTLLYTILQIAVIIRQHWLKKESKEESNDGS